MEKFIEVNSLEYALELNGETVEQFNWRTERDTDGQKAGKELEVLAKAINKGKVMDYKDTDEPKCFPVFRSVGSGVGFSFVYYDVANSYSLVGARHCVNCPDAAIFFGKQHIAIWDRYINGI